MNYEELLNEANAQGLTVRELDITGYDGLICNDRIAIHKDIPTTTEKACVLAEELGHHHTTYGDIVDQRSVSDQKQEQAARVWAYNKQIGLIGIVRCFEHGCRNRYEMAEYLGVTEKFLEEALERYKQKYGAFATLDNYVIYFYPDLIVVKMR